MRAKLAVSILKYGIALYVLQALFGVAWGIWAALKITGTI